MFIEKTYLNSRISKISIIYLILEFNKPDVQVQSWMYLG